MVSEPRSCRNMTCMKVRHFDGLCNRVLSRCHRQATAPHCLSLCRNTWKCWWPRWDQLSPITISLRLMTANRVMIKERLSLLKERCRRIIKWSWKWCLTNKYIQQRKCWSSRCHYVIALPQMHYFAVYGSEEPIHFDVAMADLRLTSGYKLQYNAFNVERYGVTEQSR